MRSHGYKRKNLIFFCARILLNYSVDCKDTIFAVREAPYWEKLCFWSRVSWGMSWPAASGHNRERGHIFPNTDLLHGKWLVFTNHLRFLCNLLQRFIARSKYNIYFSLAKLANKWIQYFACFLLIFTHRPWNQAKQFSPCLSYCLERWSSEVVSKTLQLPSPARKKETPKFYHSSWVPVGSPGVDPRVSKW